MGKDDIYVKDLRVLHQISLNDIIIIDNSALSFAIHLDNGIPILPFYDNKNDNELLILANYLKELSNAEDIRITNKHFLKYGQGVSSCCSCSEAEETKSEQEQSCYINNQNLVFDSSYSLISDNDCEFSYVNLESDKDQAKLCVLKKNYIDFKKTFTE